MYECNERRWPSRPFALETLPRARVPEVRVLWIDDFWDGPLSGVCEFAGETLYFSRYFDANFDDEREKSDDEDAELTLHPVLASLGIDDPHCRLLLLYRLTPSQLDEERYWHQLFCEHVGTHWDATSSGAERAVMDRERWSGFYDRYQRERPTLDLSLATIVAAWVL